MPRIPAPRCLRCGGPVSGRSRTAPPEGCAACASWPPFLVVLRSPFAHAGTAARAVRALKYGGWKAVADPLARSLEAPGRRLLDRLGSDGSVVVPVPLSPARRRERGFNQAELLACGLTACLGARGALRPDLLARRPGRGRQAGAGRLARRENVLGRFAATASSAGGGPAVLLIDDVVTTGATLVACARALHEAGFGPIGALTFSRTLGRPRGPSSNRKRDDRGT